MKQNSFPLIRGRNRSPLNRFVPKSAEYRSLLLIVVMSMLGCSNEPQMQTADEIFSSELDKRRIKYSVTSDGLYEIEVDEQSMTVSLENVRRNYRRDRNVDPILQLVDQVATDSFSKIPSWNDVRPFVRYSLESSENDELSEEVLSTRVTENLNQIFVYTSADRSRIRWINQSALDSWQIAGEQVVHQAEQNMAAIIAETEFEVERFDGNTLGMISTKETPFKASLILSPAFRDLVSASHGWPVYVVIPCRDFAYVIRTDNRDLLSRLGGVVLKEYHTSGYPLTKDVLEVSDRGIAVIATFPEHQ